MKRYLSKKLEELDIVLDGYMVLDSSPHTAPIAHLSQSHSGRETASYYLLGRYLDKLTDEDAEHIVREIAKLQIRDVASEYYGGMRWYREEVCVTDSNGAFFVLMPIAIAYVLCKEKMTSLEQRCIEEMLELAAHWFVKESRGALFYTNKVMSDGAMLTLIVRVLGKYQNEEESFWIRWNTYVNERGWGWGENASDGYSVIMLNALNVVQLVMRENTLKSQLMEKRDKLLSYIAFHAGQEYIPSIRSYNFSGDIHYGGLIYKMIQKRMDFEKVWDMVASVLLEATETKLPDIMPNRRKCFRKEKLFDADYAYTWMKDGIRMGSVTSFPVMPYCGNALGWQSMPISVMVEEKYIMFMRIRTAVAGTIRTQPAGSNYHEAYLSHNLVNEEWLPKWCIRSAQNENLMVVVRGIEKLNNALEGIWDEWFIPDANVEIRKTVIKAREWFLLDCDKNILALCPLDGVAVYSEGRERLKTEICRDEGYTTISTELYEGENKILCCPYLESAFAVAVIEESDKVLEYLEQITVEDEMIQEFEIPRSPETLVRRIRISDGKCEAELREDPYDMMWGM